MSFPDECLRTFLICGTYLQYLNYSNTEIGIIPAIGNLIASFAGPKLTSFITNRKASAVSVFSLCLAIQLISDILVIVIGKECLVISVAFTLMLGV